MLALPLMAFAAPQDSLTTEDAQTEINAPQVPKDSSEIKELSGLIGSIVSIWKDAKADYLKEDRPSLQSKIAWFFIYILGLLGTIQGVYILRSWSWLKQYFFKTDIKTIVKGVSLLIAAIITFLTTGGNFEAERFMVISALFYLLSDPVYNFLVARGWFKKTPKTDTQTATQAPITQ